MLNSRENQQCVDHSVGQAAAVDVLMCVLKTSFSKRWHLNASRMISLYLLKEQVVYHHTNKKQLMQ